MHKFSSQHSTSGRKKLAYTGFILLFIAVLVAGCAAPAPMTSTPTTPATVAPNTPTPQTTPQITETPQAAETSRVETAALALLTREWNVPAGDIKVVDIQPVQWPDSCLGVPQAGILCAMHVVDGFRVTLSANGQAYEVHSNTDGSQIALVPGPLPSAAGLSLTLTQSSQCETSIFTLAQDISYGSCGQNLQVVPFLDAAQKDALKHYTTTFKSFLADTPDGFLNFVGTGNSTPTAIDQRSIAAWAKITASAIRAGHANRADGLVLTWHREGGIAGFCDDLSVYSTGMVSASSCSSGVTFDMGRTWLTGKQLTQLYGWMDNLAGFDYAPESQASADALTVHLVFTGNGKTPASMDDQQAIEGFAEDLQANLTSAAAPANLDKASAVVTDFLNAYKNDPTGYAGLNDLGADLQADIRSGDQLSNLLSIDNTFQSFGVSSAQAVPGSDQIRVDVGLNFVSPIDRSFILSWENGAWVISTFVAHALPPMTPDNHFNEADQVILEYFQALQDKDQSGASALLTTAGQSDKQISTIQQAAADLASVSPLAVTLTDATAQDSLTYTVTLWVLPGENSIPGPSWQAGRNTLSIVLAQTLDGWRIDQIAPIQ